MIASLDRSPAGLLGRMAWRALVPYACVSGTGRSRARPLHAQSAPTANGPDLRIPVPDPVTRHSLARIGLALVAIVTFSGAMRPGAARAQETANVPAAGLPTAGAAIDRGRFRYARPIAAGAAGLVALPLDAAVLAHANVDGVRIATADGHEVPYILERRGDSLVVPLPPPVRLSDENDGRGRTRYRVVLPYGGLPPSRLVLRTSARVFDRDVAVAIVPGPGDDARPGRDGVVEVNRASWRGTDTEQPPPALVLSLPALRGAELVVSVAEGDNAPLPLTGLQLLLPDYRLRFYRTSGPLTLLYGRERIAAPRYDLALLAPRLLAAPATEIAAGPESAGPVTTITPTVVFWVALAIAVVALVVLLARLLRPDRTSAAPPPPPSPTTSADADE